MQQQTEAATNRVSLPIVGDASSDIDAQLKAFESEERDRLGLGGEETWVEEMAGKCFVKSEKSEVTILLGGLTSAHDELIAASLSSLGYNISPLETPDIVAYRTGKEFGNRGQCNPTYFTVGNLVKVLIHFRDEKGMSTEEIIKKFVFLTAGACGPCRFGMYVTEYRKALRDSGFDGFRVMLFQQQGGLEQVSGEESGLELNGRFFYSLSKGGIAGDVINALGYRIRPYEVVSGSTDKAMEETKKVCAEALRNDKPILAALWKCRKLFRDIEVDRTQIKPKVSVIGEFWAMTTEGAGNYNLHRFLEEEGAEVDAQLITAWALYNIWEVVFDTKNRAALRGVDDSTFSLQGLGEYGVFKRQIALWAGDKLVRVIFQAFARSLGLNGYHLPDMFEVAEVAAPHYNNDIRGGEGHMEVGKLILNVVNNKANMTLSVKPFGCMPSSGVSDGIQSLISERYPGTIYCPVETSGDGAVNFYSRIQMYLFKAKQAAQDEVQKALETTGLTIEEVSALHKTRNSIASSLHLAPHKAGATAADVVYEAGEYLCLTRLQRAQKGYRRLVRAGTKSVERIKLHAPHWLEFSRRAGAELKEIAVDTGPVLVKRLDPRNLATAKAAA